mmetsp:Transcript_30686/g.89019  ORF Transcript_30686/g.89019 Transcript_30686/m.89019 type:complete len:257 (-) Transcript_30686:6-776(-)
MESSFSWCSIRSSRAAFASSVTVFGGTSLAPQDSPAFNAQRKIPSRARKEKQSSDRAIWYMPEAREGASPHCEFNISSPAIIARDGDISTFDEDGAGVASLGSKAPATDRMRSTSSKSAPSARASIRPWRKKNTEGTLLIARCSANFGARAMSAVAHSTNARFSDDPAHSLRRLATAALLSDQGMPKWIKTGGEVSVCFNHFSTASSFACTRFVECLPPIPELANRLEAPVASSTTNRRKQAVTTSGARAACGTTR